jgi:hypothetical protein
MGTFSQFKYASTGVIYVHGEAKFFSEYRSPVKKLKLARRTRNNLQDVLYLILIEQP